MWIDKENEEDQQQQDTDSLNSPSVGAGAGGGTTGPQVKSSEISSLGTPSSMTPMAQAPKQQFGTIQDYFKGSKNQGERLGEQFTSKLADTQSKQKSDISQAATQAQSDIEKGTTLFDPTLATKAASDPTKVASNEPEFNKFIQQWNAAYKGPQSFEESSDYAKAASAAKKAQEKTAQIESTGGRQQLIQDEFGVYGQGNKGLDEALLQQSSYFPKIQQQTKDFRTIPDYLKTESQKINEAAQKGKQATQKTKESLQDIFLNKDTGVLSQFKSGLGEKVTKAKQQAGERSKAVEAALKNTQPGKVSAETLKELGLTPEEYDKLLYQRSVAQQGWMPPDKGAKQIAGEDVDFSRYAQLLNPEAQVSLENTMSPEDYARAEALAKLTQDQNILPLVNPENVGKGAKVVDFRGQNLKDYLQNRQDAIVAARDRQNQKTAPAREAVQKAIEAEKEANRRAGTIGPIFRSQPVLPTPTPPPVQPIVNEPVPQINPGIPTPPIQAPISTEPVRKDIVRAFSEGGIVKDDTLQNYLKQIKR